MHHISQQSDVTGKWLRSLDNPGQKHFSEIQEESLNNQPEIMAPPQLVPSLPSLIAKELAAATMQKPLIMQ